MNSETETVTYEQFWKIIHRIGLSVAREHNHIWSDSDIAQRMYPDWIVEDDHENKTMTFRKGWRQAAREQAVVNEDELKPATIDDLREWRRNNP